MKILIDMNLTPRWVNFLFSEGFESVHWSSIGPAPARDELIMAHADANDYVVLTNDLDFGLMLSSSGNARPSVIQLRGRLAPEFAGAPVVEALRTMSVELAVGAVVTVGATKTRLRVLPFPDRD